MSDHSRRRPRTLPIPKAAELVAESIAETFSYYAFPDRHWIKLRTNNPLEPVMREIRRRTRVVGAFPDGAGALHDRHVYAETQLWAL